MAVGSARTTSPPCLSRVCAPMAIAADLFVYQALCTRSSADTTSESARVVGTPSAAMVSDATNSRRLDRSTARPSEPRQKGVFPLPLSCNSQGVLPVLTLQLFRQEASINSEFLAHSPA